jgi:hypothetical protein
MDTSTATAPNTIEYRGIVHDATVIRETLEQFPSLPLEAKAALDARLEDLEAKAATLAAEWTAARPAAQRAASAGLARVYVA